MELAWDYSIPLFLGWNAPIGRWKYYRHAVGMIAIGLGICAIQLLPAAELSRLSLRSELSQEGFLDGSLPLWQALQYIFPFLFGSGQALPPYTLPYWGKESNLADIATYVGILPLILMGTGSSAYKHRGVIRFWLWVAIIAFLLIFGRYLFLAELLYYVPIYNTFRVPARHGIELAMAVSVLAGFGVAAIQRRKLPGAVFRRIIGASFLIMLFALSYLAIGFKQFQVRASQAGIKKLTFWPWENHAVGIPIAIFIAALLALALWNRWSKSVGSIVVLLTVLVLDLASFGFWFNDWPNIGPKVSQLEPSLTFQKFRKSLEQNQNRLVVASGLVSQHTPNSKNPIFPNLTRLWKLPTVSGYSPLIISRVSEMLQIDSLGILSEDAIHNQHRGLDLMSVQYLLSQKWPDPGTPMFSDFPASAVQLRSMDTPWSEKDLAISLGIVGQQPLRDSIWIDLPNIPLQTTAIALVTAWVAQSRFHKTPTVANLQVIDTQGNIETHPLRAGWDTAEHAYDCSDMKPQMQHLRAGIFQSISN